MSTGLVDLGCHEQRSACTLPHPWEITILRTVHILGLHMSRKSVQALIKGWIVESMVSDAGLGVVTYDTLGSDQERQFGLSKFKHLVDLMTDVCQILEEGKWPIFG